MQHTELTGDVFEIHDPEAKDHIYFLLKDQSHEFTIALSDILECLKFAEMKGEVPELPNGWWSQVDGQYPNCLNIYRDVPDEDENEEV